MKFNLLTIFPNIFDSYINESILKRAQENNHITINPINLRDFTDDKHHTTDDTPYGGGPGMVMKIEPLYKAIQHIKKTAKPNHKIIALAPGREIFTQQKAEKLSRLDEITLISGRYEGFDARLDEFIDEKISIGSYVLAGGELPSLVVLEAVARLAPGVLGSADSLETESYSGDGSYIEHPHYTRPEHFTYTNESNQEKTLSVPKVLLEGNHSEIEKWRKNQSETGK